MAHTHSVARESVCVVRTSVRLISVGLSSDVDVGNRGYESVGGQCSSQRGAALRASPSPMTSSRPDVLEVRSPVSSY